MKVRFAIVVLSMLAVAWWLSDDAWVPRGSRAGVHGSSLESDTTIEHAQGRVLAEDAVPTSSVLYASRGAQADTNALGEVSDAGLPMSDADLRRLLEQATPIAVDLPSIAPAPDGLVVLSEPASAREAVAE